MVSHGVGAAGAAVCFEELIRGGAREIIKIRNAGSLSRDIVDGDIVIASGAVREDGLTEQLVDLPYPAIARVSDLTNRLESTAEKLGIKTSTGIVFNCRRLLSRLKWTTQ